MRLQHLREAGKELDRTYWHERSTDFQKIRHIALRLGGVAGKLATYCEAREHGVARPDGGFDPYPYPEKEIKDEVIPDLLIHATQLSSLFDADMEESLRLRVETLPRLFND